MWNEHFASSVSKFSGWIVTSVNFSLYLLLHSWFFCFPSQAKQSEGPGMHSSTLHFNHRERFCKRQTLSWAGRAHKNWDPETPRFWKLPKTGWWYASIIDSETRRNLRLRPKWINVVIGRPRECEERHHVFDHYKMVEVKDVKGCI